MNVHTSPREARRSPSWFDTLPNVLEMAFEKLEFETTEAFRSLSELAAVVHVEGHSIDAESAVIDQGRWIAPGTIYVTLVYDPNSDEPVELSDSYPISVIFSVADTDLTIEGVEADISSFYE